MISLPQALVIGATSRNCGKTSFISQLLKQFSEYKPIAVKIKTLYPNDDSWHGSGCQLDSPYNIREELVVTGMKDSQRWLRSGAHKVFYIKSYHESLESALKEFLSRIPETLPLIIESNSLRDFVEPSGFFVISDGVESNYKPSAKRLLPFADQIIKTDGERHIPSPSELDIKLNKSEWIVS